VVETAGSGRRGRDVSPDGGGHGLISGGKLGFLCWGWAVGESAGVAPASPRATAPHDDLLGLCGFGGRLEECKRRWLDFLFFFFLPFFWQPQRTVAWIPLSRPPLSMGCFQ
jgi:hypothetical protein